METFTIHDAREISQKEREIFAKNLKNKLQKNKLSISELATLLSISEEDINSWIVGRTYPSIVSLTYLASIFKCPVTELV